MVVPQNNDEDVRGLVALISSDAQVDPETLVHSLKEILRDLQSNNRPVEDIVALVPVLVQLLEITGDSNIVDICCQCLELSAYNLSPADLLNKFESFLLECLWHTSSRMRQMCLRIMEAKSNSLSSVTEFVRSKFFSKALDVLLDVKQVGHSEKILELFQKIARGRLLVEQLGPTFGAWCESAKEKNTVIKCRIYELAISLCQAEETPLAVEILRDMANDLDSTDFTLTLSVLGLASQITDYANGPKFLETIGFISPVMSKFAAIASNSNPDPLLSALIAPSIFEFLTSLSSKHPREMDRLDADYNFSRTLKAATESDSDDILMHAFLLIGGIIRTRDGLFWLDLNVPSAIFEMATAARFSMGRVKSAALSAFGSLLQDDTKYPASDLDVISGKLFESIGGLNGVIAIAQKSIEKHDIVSSYAILNNLLRFSWGARTLQDSGIAISFFFSPPKGEKEKSLRDALLTTVLEQPNVEATLTPDLVKRFHTLLHDKSVPAPTVAYMEL